jgi:hypothetical protein
MGDLRIPILFFADDMVLMANRKEKLERMVRKVKECGKKSRLRGNVNKTNVMKVSKNDEKVAKVKYEEEKLGAIFCLMGSRSRQTERAALGFLNKQVE